MTARPLDHADDEAGDVVFAVGVEAGHLGGLAADERAAVLAARRARRRSTTCSATSGEQPAGREVVEEEQRLGALDEDVVDAVIDEIGADGVVAAGHERDLQLRADAVGARHEDRLRRYRSRSSRNRPPNDPMSDSTPGVNVAARERPDAPDRFVAGVDVDAGWTVVHRRQKSSVADRASASELRARRAFRRLPVGAPRTAAKKRSLSRSSSSMSKPSASSAIAGSRSRSAGSRAASASAACSAARRWRARARPVRASDRATGCRRRTALPAASSRPATRQRAQAGRRAAQQLLEARCSCRRTSASRSGSSRATRS